MEKPDSEPVLVPESELAREGQGIFEILKDQYGLRPANIRGWFHKAISPPEKGLIFDLKIIPRKLSNSPLFLDLAKRTVEQAGSDNDQRTVPVEGLKLTRNLIEEEIAEADIPDDAKEQLLAELPKRESALVNVMQNFPQRNWENEAQYLETAQKQRKHIEVWMTLLTAYEPMLIMQVTDTSGPSSIADFRGAVSRHYYGPEAPLFASLVDWIQKARELSGQPRSQELDLIMNDVEELQE